MSGIGINQELKEKQYFHGLIARDDVADLLFLEGEFLLRVTEPKMGMVQSVVISVLHDKSIAPTEGISHYIIRVDDKGYHCEKFCCKTIPELVEKYIKTGSGLDGAGKVKLVHKSVRQPWELENKDVHLEKKLGEGAYGEVWMGDYRPKGNIKEKISVAVKQTHMETLNKDQINEVMGEARIMRKNPHPNIVRLIGIASLEQPLLIVMELADHGSLDSYLQKNGAQLSAARKAEMCADVAFALHFLKRQNILHRDLAVRNCLLFKNNTVKLADFGKSQSGPTYAMEPKEKLPIRWLSPETMVTRKFTFASEVWSFGIVCWEIFSNGAEPYPGYMVREVNEQVLQGLRMPMPEDTPKEIRDWVEKGCFSTEVAREKIKKLAARFSTYTGRPDPTLTQDPSDPSSTKTKPKSSKNDPSSQSPAKPTKHKSSSKDPSKRPHAKPAKPKSNKKPKRHGSRKDEGGSEPRSKDPKKSKKDGSSRSKGRKNDNPKTKKDHKGGDNSQRSTKK